MVDKLLNQMSLQSRFVLSNLARRRRQRISQRVLFSQTYTTMRWYMAKHLTCGILLALKKRCNKVVTQRWHAWTLHHLLPSRPRVSAEPSFFRPVRMIEFPNLEELFSSLTTAGKHMFGLCTPCSLLQLTCSHDYPLSLGRQDYVGSPDSLLVVVIRSPFCGARKGRCWLDVIPSSGRAQSSVFAFHASPSIKQDMKSVIGQYFTGKRASEIVGRRFKCPAWLRHGLFKRKCGFKRLSARLSQRWGGRIV